MPHAWPFLLMLSLLLASCGSGELLLDSAAAPTVSPAGAGAGAPAYDDAALQVDLAAVVGTLPKAALTAALTAAQRGSLLVAMDAAQRRFFPELPLPRLSRSLLCAAAQASTLNPELGILRPSQPTSTATQGFLQLRSSIFLVAYARHGNAIIGRTGAAALSPTQVAQLDLSDVGVQVLLWAWNVRNDLATSPSVPSDYGNAVYAWLVAPGQARQQAAVPATTAGLQDLEGCWTRAGFATDLPFATLLATRLSGPAVAYHR